MDSRAGLHFRKSLIKKQACFFQLTDDELEELASLLVEVTFASGETIVTEGEPVDSVYFIAKGTADVRQMTAKNKTRTAVSIAKLGPDDAIGLNETGFYSLSGRRTATVVALESMVLFYLSMAAFHGFALAHAHVSSIMRENATVFLSLKQTNKIL